MKSLHRSIGSMLLTCLSVMLLISTAAIGQSKSDDIDALLDQYLSYGKFNGSALVAKDGEVILKKGYGLANMEWDIPNSSNTKHR
ncbi:hypothetical protein [Maribacter dokdonensis]|nr:hypothetical protein [Maribacter dokdonensis]